MPTHVILTKDIETLGQQGDIVTVKDGYARNYLIPRALALAATKANRKRAEDLKRKRAEQAARELEAAKAFAEKLAKLQITIPLQVGEDGKTFGAVTAQDIADALVKHGVDVTRKQVELERPIKQLGEFEVKVRLHAELSAPLKITVAKR
jgi:large subunit ribosomal protein L9